MLHSFPWYPNGPVPDDGIAFLMQPNLNKSIYSTKSSVEESDLIATNGAYVSQETNATTGHSNVSVENVSSTSDTNYKSDSGEYYDYDYVSKFATEGNAEEEIPESIIINVNTTSIAESRSVAAKVNFLNYLFICIAIVSLL